MKVFFHDAFYQVYTSDPAAAGGRMEAIVKALGHDFPFVTPEPATDEMLLRVHGKPHIDGIRQDKMLDQCARLAAGGTVGAALAAMEGEPAFALVRPPGHHASPNSCWGFCYFNNMAVSIRHLLATGKIKKALILDFDLHFGDGTDNIFQADQNVIYRHPESSHRETFMKKLREDIDSAGIVDIIGVSAGFDRGREDWGNMLLPEDYKTIGQWVKESTEAMCAGRRFGVFEGGYNHSVLGGNVRTFLEGLA